MRVIRDTKDALVNIWKGYFTTNNITYKINESVTTKAFSSTYDAISVLARCTDLIIDTAASINFIVVEDMDLLTSRTTFSRFENLLAYPDPTTSELQFRKLIYRDLFFQGNAFIYNLGNQLQLLENVEYSPTNRPTLGKDQLEESRLMHVRLLNEKSKQYGKAYITRISDEISLISSMLKFQSNYFNNNGFPGVILESDHPMSKRSKERMAEEFTNMFSIQRGLSSTPFVLDNSMKFKDIQKNFKDLQFIESINNLSRNIIASLGVPEVLLHSGNNANILPNVKVFIYLTIAPFVDSVASELSRHMHQFYPGTKKLKIVPNYENLPILKEDFLKLSNSVKTLYTTGILNQNEARRRLGYKAVEDGDEFLKPANITGSHYEGHNTNEEEE